MGIRFNEPLLSLPATPLSRAVLPGTVQLPPDGKPILLLCDAQTIGGYPVLGHIIAADLPRAAQLRPGDTVCFSETTAGTSPSPSTTQCACNRTARHCSHTQFD